MSEYVGRLLIEAARKLVAQGGPALSSINKGCVYRNAEGKACLLGQLIPDARYSINLEGEKMAVVARAIDPDRSWTRGELSMLADAQQLAHDDLSVLETDWPRRVWRGLLEVADLNGETDMILKIRDEIAALDNPA